MRTPMTGAKYCLDPLQPVVIDRRQNKADPKSRQSQVLQRIDLHKWSHGGAAYHGSEARQVQQAVRGARRPRKRRRLWSHWSWVPRQQVSGSLIYYGVHPSSRCGEAPGRSDLPRHDPVCARSVIDQRRKCVRRAVTSIYATRGHAGRKATPGQR